MVTIKLRCFTGPGIFSIPPAVPQSTRIFPMSNSPWSHHRNANVSDDIDFEIKGQELQFLEIELDPGESAVAEAGAMVWKDASVGMTTVFGDGSGGADGGFMGKLLGAGKRL